MVYPPKYGLLWGSKVLALRCLLYSVFGRFSIGILHWHISTHFPPGERTALFLNSLWPHSHQRNYVQIGADVFQFFR